MTLNECQKGIKIMETKLQTEIKRILIDFPQYWEGDTLLKNKLIDDIRSYDETVINALLSNELVKDTYSIELESGSVFKIEDFISMLRYKNYLDNSYTKYTNEIGLTSEGKYLKYNADVVLDFPHKDSTLEGGMSKEDVGKKEIYYHNVIAKEEVDTLLSPKVLTNIRRYDGRGKHEIANFDDTDNLIVKGNNLIALHALKNRYTNKVKLIYIDPPYNTEEDSFMYNDSFSRSTWLTFMKNRLEIAKDMLTDDGFLFVQISDKEQAYLKVLCDELMGEGNFLTNICVKMSHLSGPKMAHKDKKIPKIKEFVLIYAKNKQKVRFNPDYVPVTWEEAFDRYSSFVDRKGYDEDNCDKWEVKTLNEILKDRNIKKDTVEEHNFKIEHADSIFRTARNRSFDFSPFPKKMFTKITRDDGVSYFIYKGEDVLFASSKIKEINGTKTPVAPIGDIWTDIGINN